jgi:acetyl-CoA C-acetyltransferase
MWFYTPHGGGMDERLPIIVGVGQITQRPGAERPLEPLGLMAAAARAAEEDAGASELLKSLDAIRVINVLSWPSKAPAHDLAKALGVAPREAIYTAVGGNTPQWTVNQVAEAIHEGAIELALIAGAESMYSARRARAQGIDLGWSPRGNPETDAGDTRQGSSAAELAHGATVPTRIYPLFENALRAHYGQTIDEHQRVMGDLMATFSEVASRNEHAWFREARLAEEIATPTYTNRYIAFPYPKYMNAIMDVDQGAALLMTSVAGARRLGVPEERWVYLWGCGDATDHWFISERVNYHSSPAIRTAGARALSMAGVTIDDVRYLDIYSCFPSAVQISRDALSIAPSDPRPLTVTGGLPYFGGPGNNYVSHSIAAMTQRLRDDRGAVGLVTANGWYVTKHSVGVYSAQPPRSEWRRSDPKADQATVDAEPHPEPVGSPSGAATVETYTVIFDRDGCPSLGIVIGRDTQKRRFIANAPADVSLLESMTQREFVGAKGNVSQDGDGKNVFTPA